MDVNQENVLPSVDAIDTLSHAAKLGLRLTRKDGCLVYKSERRKISAWVEAKLQRNKRELAEFIPDLGDANDCIVPIRPVAKPTANLVCVHPLNGSSFDYHHVAAAMANTYSVYGCDALDGLFARRPMVSVESMANHYIDVLHRTRLTQLPLALYGGSSGGSIALEMARKMAEAGSPPILLVLGDTRDEVSWALHAHYQGIRKRMVWNAFLEAFFPKEMWDVSPPDHVFWTLEENERLSYLRERIISLQSSGEVLAALDPDLIADYFPPFRQYVNCYREYEPKPYFGRALFLRASRSPQNVTSGMISMLQGDAHVHTIEGMHLSFYWPPVSLVVSETISKAIADSQTGRRWPQHQSDAV